MSEDQLDDDQRYEDWLVRCRQVEPTAQLADRVMADVREFDSQRRRVWLLRLTNRLERSVWARSVALCGAALIGSTPFWYLAYVAKFLGP